jgi:hypothetical protein
VNDWQLQLQMDCLYKTLVQEDEGTGQHTSSLYRTRQPTTRVALESTVSSYLL